MSALKEVVQLQRQKRRWRNDQTAPFWKVAKELDHLIERTHKTLLTLPAVPAAAKIGREQRIALTKSFEEGLKRVVLEDVATLVACNTERGAPTSEIDLECLSKPFVHKTLEMTMRTRHVHASESMIRLLEWMLAAEVCQQNSEDSWRAITGAKGLAQIVALVWTIPTSRIERDVGGVTVELQRPGRTTLSPLAWRHGICESELIMQWVWKEPCPRQRWNPYQGWDHFSGLPGRSTL